MMELDARLEEFRIDICVRGYHIYKDVWYAMIGKVLVCETDPNNSQDRYSVAVNKYSR